MTGRIILTIMLCFCVSAKPLRAEVTPVPIGSDPHIQSVLYDPQEVVALNVTSGFAVTVVFSPDERIETVTVGDSAGWQVQVNRRADALVVKPVGYAPSTNLTVMTDQRSYNFTLATSSTTGSVNPYLLRFTYVSPEPADGSQAQDTQTGYSLKGALELRPEAMSDDGEFTSIIWPADVAIPAIYSVDDSGQLALVNGAVRDGAFVIEGVYRKLIFIRGKRRATTTRLIERERP